MTIIDSGEEWSLFVGVTDTTNEAMNEFVNYVAGTFVRDAQNVGEDLTIYEVSIDETPELKAVPVIEKESEPSTDPEGLYYTDIQFLGLDGEQLKYKGVAYDKRTYDSLNKTRELPV